MARGFKADKLWREAVMRAVKRQAERGGKGQYLEKLADKLVQCALEGDIGALKEIGDRLDGRPAQSVAVEENREITVRIVA